MSKRNLGEKIKLSSYDDMFGMEEAETTDNSEVKGQIVDLPIVDLHTFENHPFRVIDDESMEEMVESIKEYGVLVPAIVRPRAKGGYEILSGHRRHHACELAGLETMPAIIKDCSDDEATVIMVDANIQREDILISEKAKAYSMKYEAMKHQGSAGGRSLVEMSSQSGESRATIQRLIAVSKLDKELSDMVDSKKIGIRQGVDLATLPSDEQKTVHKVIKDLEVTLTWDDTTRIREAYEKGYFNADYLRDILSHEKVKARKVVFNQKKLDNYFDPSMSNEEIENLIVELLDEWKRREEGD